MIDDLDRCPKESIVKVLEAVILLLVNAPITCWLAIDSRVVVAAIEDYFGVRRCVCAHSASKSTTHPPSHPSLRPPHLNTYDLLPNVNVAGQTPPLVCGTVL